MDNKKTIIICAAIIIIAVIVSGIMIYHANEVQKELNKPIIYNNTIDGVGTFQSVNATNFTNIKDDGQGQIYYKSNLTGAEVSVNDNNKKFFNIEELQAEKVNESPKGHTIYKVHATVGEHAGEVRYCSVINDKDNNRFMIISSPNKNLTDLMVDSFKILQPVTKQETKNTDKVTTDTTSNSQSSSNSQNDLQATLAEGRANMPAETRARYEAREQAAANGNYRQADYIHS